MAVFRERGYSHATMADIVDATGMSIGSIYHHFGGKDELFCACVDRIRSDLRTTAGLDPEGAMPAAGGWESDYFLAVWERRESARVFLTTDHPADFNAGVKMVEYYRGPGEHVARILTAVALEACRILVDCEDPEEAHRLTKATVRLLDVVRAAGL
jgi:AcrR family transcriptional regulator